MARYIVTVTPPTPNGDLHLGHLSGPFLAADICRRSLMAKGHEVIMVCYSDDYQSYLPRKAEALNRSAADYGALMRRAIVLSSELAGVEFDHFPPARDNPWFRDSVEHYLDCVAEDVSAQVVSVHRCPNCRKWGHEAWGRGSCNSCGTSSDASQCEGCASKPIPALMTGMTCIGCGTPMRMETQTAQVWALGRHFETVAAWHATRGMRDDLRDYLAANLAKTSDTWPITRPGDAGLPVARFGGDPVHTWFMGLSGYRAAVKEYLEDHPERGRFADWWSPQTHLVHFLGFDCSYSHAIAYAVQQVCDPAGPTIGRFVTNRFLMLDGDDFSTSRGNAVWIKDVTGLYPADAIRLFTALHAPETKAENFVMATFKAWVQEVFRPLCAELTRAVEQGLPAQSGSRWTGTAAAIACADASRLDSFSMQCMARSVMRLLDEVRAAPAADRPAGYRLAIDLIAPILPTLSETLARTLTHEPA